MSYEKRHWRTKLDKDHITPVESPSHKTPQSPGPDEYEEIYAGVLIPRDPEWDSFVNKVILAVAVIVGILVYKYI